MKVGEKIALLRQLEGNLRGFGRALTKSEVARLIREESSQSISEAYLSQIESGKRPHMTATTRATLAEFFRIHPGYLVDDPEGFGTELTSVAVSENDLDTWLESGALAMGNDAQLSEALSTLAAHGSSRELIILMARLAQSPEVLLSLRSLVEEAQGKKKQISKANGRRKSR